MRQTRVSTNGPTVVSAPGRWSVRSTQVPEPLGIRHGRSCRCRKRWSGAEAVRTATWGRPPSRPAQKKRGKPKGNDGGLIGTGRFTPGTLERM